jgi:hypothetical protein
VIGRYSPTIFVICKRRVCGNISARLRIGVPVTQMKRNRHQSSDNAKTDNLFFVGILIALIGCTLFSGGTAIMLASEALNEATLSVAQLP